jgi:DNA-binding MarR family transcriptional regulator
MHHVGQRRIRHEALRALARRELVTRATVTGLLDSLEKPGFVRRLRHPTDRRSIVVEITDEGLSVLAQVRTLIPRNERAWMGTLSEAELATYISLLHRVQDALAVTTTPATESGSPPATD